MTQTQNAFAALLTPARIILGQAAVRPAELVGQAAGLLSGMVHGDRVRIPAATASIYLGLWQRAQLNVAQVSPGVALLDVRQTAITTPKAAIVRLAEPLLWVEGQPAIHTLIACTGPATQPRQHLNAVNVIRQYFADPQAARLLSQASSAEHYLQQIASRPAVTAPLSFRQAA